MLATFIDEVAQYLQANNIGTIGTNLFEGNLPDDDTTADNAICVYESTGIAPEQDIPLYHPAFQVIIRNAKLDNGQTVCQNIRNLLHNFYNNTFITNGTYVYSCNLVAQGGHIGMDDKGRDLFSLNFLCITR